MLDMASKPRVKASKSNKTIAAIVKATFPNWKGRKVFVQESASIERWIEGGGTSDRDMCVDLTSMNSWPLQGASITSPKVSWNIEEGWAVVNHAMSCGEDAGVTITIAPLPEALARRIDDVLSTRDAGALAVASDILRDHYSQGGRKSDKDHELALRLMLLESRVAEMEAA